MSYVHFRWTADATKNGKWLSHIKWPSLKTELKQKIDRQRKTRSDGDIRLNEVDKMILEIIGPKSAELGIEIPQNGNGQSVEYSIINIANSGMGDFPQFTAFLRFISVISEQSSTSTPPPINDKGTKFKTSGLTKRKAQDVESSDYEKKMNIWLDSKIRLNERMQYKLELEIFKLENELQLSHRYPNVVVKNGKNKE